jgi:hypothetical protein
LEKLGEVKVDNLWIDKVMLWVGMERVQMTWGRMKKWDDVNRVTKDP